MKTGASYQDTRNAGSGKEIKIYMEDCPKIDELLRQAIDDFQNGFSGKENTCELTPRVKEVMPMEGNDYKIVSVQGNMSKFKASIKVNFKNEEDINTLIKNYRIKNNETLRISKTKKVESEKTVLVKYFMCHHNTRHEATKFPNQILASEPTKRFKNTNCPFSLIIRNWQESRSCGFLGSVVDMEWNHNNSVQSLYSLSFKDIPASVVIHIIEMFASGLLPDASYRELLRQLRSECKDDLEYHRRLSDRSAALRRKNFNDMHIHRIQEGTFWDWQFM